MKNRVFLYLFFMLVLVGCQKPESMEDFDALFTHKKSVFVKDCLSEAYYGQAFLYDIC